MLTTCHPLFSNVGTNFAHKLRSSGQSSWLQIQRSKFDSRSYQMLWVVVGLERGPLSLMSTTEELLVKKKVVGSGLEIRDTAVGIRRADHAAPPISKSWQWLRRQAEIRSVGIVRWRTQVTELGWRMRMESWAAVRCSPERNGTKRNGLHSITSQKTNPFCGRYSGVIEVLIEL
jgi:hypothetical protein